MDAGREGSTASAPAERTDTTAESRLLRRLGTALVLVLAAEVVLRIRFPWDLLMWAESPFMTNLLKLHNGQPVFSPPSDVNSFVYSPGLEYLTYALLAPFGAALDVRWARAVNVAVGLAAAVLAAAIGTRAATALGAPRRATFWALACGTTLILFRNFTADVMHPDNLQMLHAVATLWLTFAAIADRRFALAVLAAAFAGVGMWTKQVEVLAPVGAVTALLLGVRWERRQALAIVAAAALASAIAVAVLLRAPLARFYLVELLLAQTRGSMLPVWALITIWEPFVFGHRLLLVLLLAGAVRQIWRGANGVARAFLLSWASIGATTALPALSGYLKVMGTWNNFGLLDLWMFLAVGVGLVVPAAVTPLDRRLRYAAVLALLLSLFPLKIPPTPEMYAYGERLDAAIGADVAAGRRVLLAHGTMPLIRAGDTSIPLDRANSALELSVGARHVIPAGLLQRLRERVYDRIYLNSGWYASGAWMIGRHYQKVDSIPRVRTLDWLPIWYQLLTGHDALFSEVRIYERR